MNRYSSRAFNSFGLNVMVEETCIFFHGPVNGRLRPIINHLSHSLDPNTVSRGYDAFPDEKMGSTDYTVRSSGNTGNLNWVLEVQHFPKLQLKNCFPSTVDYRCHFGTEMLDTWFLYGGLYHTPALLKY